MAGNQTSEELAETHAEVQAAKKALADGTTFLGMSGDTLQRYFLKLCEKENLLLSRKIQEEGPTLELRPLLPRSPSAASWANAAPQAARPAPVAAAASGAPAEAAATAVSNGSAVAAQAKEEKQSPPGKQVAAVPDAPKAREPPAGETRALDKDSLASVMAHLTDYEAAPIESNKALRALASLIYDSPRRDLGQVGIVDQVLRVMQIHISEPRIAVQCMRVLGNLASDPDVAVKRLASEDVFCAVLACLREPHTVKELPLKASETAARIVAAEVCPIGEACTDGGRPRTVTDEEIGHGTAMTQGLFAASMAGGVPVQAAVGVLLQQLVANEVVDADLIGRGMVAATAGVTNGDRTTAGIRERLCGWCKTVKTLCAHDGLDLGEALTTAGAMTACAKLMEGGALDCNTDLHVIQALSDLVGRRKDGLDEFANVRGAKLIGDAMRRHPDEASFQTNTIRAMSCGTRWDDDIRERSGFTYGEAIELIKAAMAKHPGHLHIQGEGLAALCECLNATDCVEHVRKDAGEELVMSTQARFPVVGEDGESNSGHEAVQTWASTILEKLRKGP